MVPKILFEDEYFLVLDKPTGWIVNEASTTKSTPVVQSWISENLDFAISKDNKFRSGVVHRLDKETSGILLIAKTEEVFYKLQSQFKARNIKKVYYALVHGKVDPKKGKVNAPVGRLPHNRKRFGVVVGGKPAKTSYRLDTILKKNSDYFSLMTLFPESGRTHQLRVHMKYLGYPIVADEFYAGRKTARDDRKWCPRLFLHAAELTLSHPKTDKTTRFKSSFPRELKTCLASLEEE